MKPINLNSVLWGFFSIMNVSYRSVQVGLNLDVHVGGTFIQISPEIYFKAELSGEIFKRWWLRGLVCWKA